MELIRTWALDVSDNASRSVVHKFNSDLGDTTSRTCLIESRLDIV